MRIVMIIFYVLLILLGISFAVLNASTISINFFFTTFNLPTSVFVLIILAIGLFCGYLCSFGRYWRLCAEHRKLKNQLKLTEKEIKNLRAIPLQD